MQVGDTSCDQHMDYDHMLELVTKLQADLHDTKATAKILTCENLGLKQNYTDVKASLISTRERYTSTRQAHLLLVKSKSNKERELEAQLLRQRSNLDDSRVEMNTLKQKIDAQDHDTVLATVEEELKKVYRVKLIEKDQEVTLEILQ